MGFKIPDIYTFGDMKARYQNLVIEGDYFQFLRSAEQQMFEWDGLPENIDKNRLEDFLNLTGGCVWKMIDGVHMVAPYPARTGQIDMWGYGETAHSTTINGISLEGVVGVDAAIIYNNGTRTPQTDLFTTADIFAAIDSASKVNVKLSRIAPLFSAENDKQASALDEILQQIIDGEPKTIASKADVSINDIAGNTKPLEIVELTQPEKIQYLQYLSQYFDIRLRRHFMRRGLSLKTSDKQAQVTKDEVHGMDAVTWFYPLSKLQARQDGAEMVNKIYGTNISVRFSELWQQEYDAYKLRTKSDDLAAENAQNEMEEGVENESITDENGAE